MSTTLTGDLYKALMFVCVSVYQGPLGLSARPPQHPAKSSSQQVPPQQDEDKLKVRQVLVLYVL